MTEPKPEYEVSQPDKRKRGRPRNGDYPHKSTIRFSNSQNAFLESLAAQEGITYVDAVRACVAWYMDYVNLNASPAYLRRLIDNDRNHQSSSSS